MSSFRFVLPFAFGVIAMAALGQAPQPGAIASADVSSQIAMVNYERGPKSTLALRPTPIATRAGGEAQVAYKDGNARIKAKVKGLAPPPDLGSYTTYILWALTPDGRAANLGVIAGIKGDKGSLDTKYVAPQFALIVTAEPHFAVTAPSNMVVLYNVTEKVKGTQTKVTSLTERSDYSRMEPIPVEKKRPPDLVAAEYSVQMANAAGAQLYASSQYSGARQKLADAEDAAMASKRSDRKQAPALAREAVLAGEDARREALTSKQKADAEQTQRLAAARAADEAAADATAEAEQRQLLAEREDLLNRLNEALPTRETDRGLVSEIGGVQFPAGAATLNSSAKASLARFAGIVASYPDLKVKIEGHTDSTGSEQTNEALSRERAIAVRDYLVSQHVPASNVDAEGLGSSHPIADNDTVEGRARNRRVEIEVTGGPLETEAEGASPAARL